MRTAIDRNDAERVRIFVEDGQHVLRLNDLKRIGHVERSEHAEGHAVGGQPGVIGGTDNFELLSAGLAVGVRAMPSVGGGAAPRPLPREKL
jgi:hypothetical protein